jgi:hypothetical protein
MQLSPERIATLTIVLLNLPAPVLAQQETEHIRGLLVEAIRNGKSSGEMGGEVGSEVRAIFARTFGSEEPIRVSVDRLKPVTPAGCFRLRVKTTQAGVYDWDPRTKTRAAAPRDMTLAYEVTFCANGHFPEEGGGE